MQKILLLFILPLTASAQSLDGFVYSNAEVHYEQVFELADTTAMLAHIMGVSGSRDIERAPGIIKGRVAGAKINVMGLGFRATNIDDVILGELSYQFLVQVNPGKYKVTISGVSFYDPDEEYKMHLTNWAYDVKRMTFAHRPEARGGKAYKHKMHRSLMVLTRYFSNAFGIDENEDMW